MRILACLLPLAALAAAPVEKAPAPKPCPTVRISAADRTRPVTVHPLNEEPGAKQEIAVQRSVDGCIRPIVVRDNVGGASK